MVVALYDLAKSPPTFDFTYAVVQTEIERQRRGDATLAFHILTNEQSGQTDFYSAGEFGWRVRHIIVPLTQLLPVAAEVHVTRARPTGPEVFSRPYGLHWLSDVAILSQGGADVQVLRARDDIKAVLIEELEAFTRGRRLITITLRETVYASTRNSNVRAWAALARILPRDKYAVVVLRDHERVSEPLPGDWGEVLTLPKAVWFLHQRIALYEIAWLNLAVNNGPLGILALDRKIRFQIFKLDGGTWETSPQHFRRLGIEPGMNFPFLQPDQQMIWEDDTFLNLRAHVFAALERLESASSAESAPAGDAVACLAEAARRDHRAGKPAADAIARIPAGDRRRALAIEWADMLMDEGRFFEAADALLEAPPGLDVVSKANVIVSICRDNGVVDASRSPRETQSRDLTRGSRPAGDPLEARTAEVAARSLVVELEAGCTLEEAITMLGIAERERRLLDLDFIALVTSGADGSLLTVAALFPSVTDFALVGCTSSVWKPRAEANKDWAAGMALVPPRASDLLAKWLRANNLAAGYIVDATAQDDAAQDDARRLEPVEQQTGGQPRPVVHFATLKAIWPIEMLAALLERADVWLPGDPLASRLAEVLDLGAGGPITRKDSLTLGRDVTLMGSAVRSAPDVPHYRAAFAASLVRFDPAPLARPAALRALRKGGIIQAIALTLRRRGRAAAAIAPFAVGLVLALAPLRRALEQAAHADWGRIDDALGARPLRAGTGALLLEALLRNVAIQNPVVLTLLERIRRSALIEILHDDDYEPSPTVAVFLEALACQVWIQDGILIDPALDGFARAGGDSRARSIALARRLVRTSAIG